MFVLITLLEHNKVAKNNNYITRFLVNHKISN